MQRSRLFSTMLALLLAGAGGCAQYLGYDTETRELYTDWTLEQREPKELSIDFVHEPRMEDPRLTVKATCESVDSLVGDKRIEDAKIERYACYQFADEIIEPTLWIFGWLIGWGRSIEEGDAQYLCLWPPIDLANRLAGGSGVNKLMFVGGTYAKHRPCYLRRVAQWFGWMLPGYTVIGEGMKDVRLATQHDAPVTQRLAAQRWPVAGLALVARFSDDLQHPVQTHTDCRGIASWDVTTNIDRLARGKSWVITVDGNYQGLRGVLAKSYKADDLGVVWDRPRAAPAPGQPVAQVPAPTPRPAPPVRAPQPKPHALKAKGQAYALLVGVGHGAGAAGGSGRPYAAADVAALRNALVAGGRFKPENVVVLTDTAQTQPTALNILVRLRSLALAARPEDTVLFAFVGQASEINDQDVLIPIDGQPKRLADTAVPLKRILDWLDICKAERQIVLLNASGLRTLFHNSPASTRPERRAVISACSEGESSHIDAATKRSVFVLSVAQALSGEADANRDGKVTVDEVYQFAAKRVKSWRADRPDASPQTPWSDYEPAPGEIVLALSPGAIAPRPRPLPRP